MNKLVDKPLKVPDADDDATPMERLEAFARRIVHVPKTEIDKRETKNDKHNSS